MTAFQPRRADGRALHRVAYEFVVRSMESGYLKPGGIIQHDELAGEMEVTYPSSGYFQAVNKAITTLQQQFHRSMVPVRGTGYQLVEGLSQLDKGRSEQGRAARQMSKAVATVTNVDDAALQSDSERVTLAQVRKGFAVIAAVIGQQAERIAEHEAQLEVLQSARMDDRARIAAVEKQIERISEKL